MNAIHSVWSTIKPIEPSEKIRWALNHNVRTSGDKKDFTGGSVWVILYKRNNNENWKGSGAATDQDGQQVLVKVGVI